MRASYKAHLEAELAKVPQYRPSPESMFKNQWSGMVWPADAKAQHDPDTGVDSDVLQTVGKASVTVPEGFVRAFQSWLS